MIKKLLTNEIAYLIGHAPSADELASAMEYLNDALNDKSTVESVSFELLNWKHDCMHKCDGCGEYFLELPATCDHFDAMGMKFCSDKCATDWYIENVK